jgi:hypothetical protein
MIISPKPVRAASIFKIIFLPVEQSQRTGLQQGVEGDERDLRLQAGLSIDVYGVVFCDRFPDCILFVSRFNGAEMFGPSADYITRQRAISAIPCRSSTRIRFPPVVAIGAEIKSVRYVEWCKHQPFKIARPPIAGDLLVCRFRRLFASLPLPINDAVS